MASDPAAQTQAFRLFITTLLSLYTDMWPRIKTTMVSKLFLSCLLLPLTLTILMNLLGRLAAIITVIVVILMKATLVSRSFFLYLLCTTHRCLLSFKLAPLAIHFPVISSYESSKNMDVSIYCLL